MESILALIGRVRPSLLTISAYLAWYLLLLLLLLFAADI